MIEDLGAVVVCKELLMGSLLAALSDAFDVDASQVRPESAVLEIDRFDGWRLAPDTDVGLLPSCVRVVVES
jgi:hypothetical protein